MLINWRPKVVYQIWYSRLYRVNLSEDCVLDYQQWWLLFGSVRFHQSRDCMCVPEFLQCHGHGHAPYEYPTDSDRRNGAWSRTSSAVLPHAPGRFLTHKAEEQSIQCWLDSSIKQTLMEFRHIVWWNGAIAMLAINTKISKHWKIKCMTKLINHIQFNSIRHDCLHFLNWRLIFKHFRC